MSNLIVRGVDGIDYFHEDNWKQWVSNRCQEYPCPQGHYRFDLQLSSPRRFLQDVPVSRNPHGFGRSPHLCYYLSRNWSTIYNVAYGAFIDDSGIINQGYRMIVESGCPMPIWGEKITLLSTSSSIEDEPWGRNPANKFAFFRDYYWSVKSRFLHDWTPIRDELGSWGIARNSTITLPAFDWNSTIQFMNQVFGTYRMFRRSKPILKPNFNWQREGF
jgi:hypothetical protein